MACLLGRRIYVAEAEEHGDYAMTVELDSFIEFGRKRGLSYIDIRVESYESESVGAEDGKPREAAHSTERGVGVRALAGGSWGFSASVLKEGDEAATIRRVVDEAGAMARAVESSARVKLAPIRAARDEVTYPLKVKPLDISLEEKMALCVETSSRALKAGTSVMKSSAGIDFLTIEKTFASSEGANIKQTQTVSLAGVYAQAMKAGISEYYSDTIGGLGGYELIQDVDFSALGEEVGRKAELLAGAKPTPTGKTVVVLDPKFCSLLSHEIMGHPSEADRVLGKEAAWAGGSWWKDKVGEHVFSEHLTVVSDATVGNYLGSFRYDDEGVPSKRIINVEKGTIREFLQSRETADAYGVEPNGTMRASSYLFAPLIRMTNTYIEKSDWKLDEMMREVKDGIYLKGDKVPSIDSRRFNFQISGKEAYAIRNGELAEPLRSPTLTGTAPEFLSSIDAVGEDLVIFPIANCGKGEPMQTMRVGNGGPHVRGYCMVTGPR
jgi:TldD protein